MRFPRPLLLVATLLLTAAPAHAQEGQVEVLWLGHATTRITSVSGKVIVIDPFLKQNPTTPEKYKDLAALGKVDLILVTHGHSDHVQDLRELAERSGAKVVANFEYALQLAAIGALDGGKVIAMNKGGTVSPVGRGIKIHMVPAEHSSSVDLVRLEMPRPGPDAQRYLSGGAPVGYVVELENGVRIYHSGDTHVFGDMALIREFHELDLALVCIGGHFTMGPEQAAYAVRELLKPRRVVPIHFGTYPVINRTPEEFAQALGDAPVELTVLKPGESLRL